MSWQLIETQGEKPRNLSFIQYISYLIVGRLQHSSVVGQGKLYIFGGEPDRQRQLNDLHILDLRNVIVNLEIICR